MFFTRQLLAICSVVVALIGVGIETAQAQHSDVDFRYTAGQIVPDLSPDGMVFRTSFPTGGFDSQFTIQPGFASETDIGAGIGAGDEIVYNVLDDLFFWDELTMALETPAPGTQIRIGNVGGSVPDTIVDGSSGEQLGSFSPAANRIGSADGGGDFHSHLDFRLEPPGGVPAAGAYGLKLSLSSDAAGIADSDPFFIAFNFGLSSSLFDQAVLDFDAALSPCVIGDANCDGYVDIAGDILTGFSNFTGPGSFGKTRAEGDVHRASGATAGDDPHDGDVDVSDILTMFGAFTGPPSDEVGLGAPAEAGDPAIPDLIYDAGTGEVVFDLDGAAGLIGYSLKSAGGFLAGGHTPILGGVTTSLTTELAEAALSTPGLPASIGFVFPLGMDLTALSAFLTENTVSTGLGAPLVPFDLVVVGGTVVPEPATWTLAAMAVFGLFLVGRRSMCRGR